MIISKELLTELRRGRTIDKVDADWSIVTALRGPDFSGNPDLKRRTTAVIRAVVCPEMSRNMGAFTAHPSDRFELKADDFTGDNSHFLWHVLKAAEVLGLLGVYDTSAVYQKLRDSRDDEEPATYTSSKTVAEARAWLEQAHGKEQE